MNPFEVPAAVAPRRPHETALSLAGMRSVFAVGSSVVEVETSHWSGRETYRVDGAVTREVRNLGWHVTQTLNAGAATVEISSRWYPLGRVAVAVDGQPWIDDLFPQFRPVKALATFAVGMVTLVLTASIVYDVVRIARTWASAG